MSKIEVNTVDVQCGSTLTLGSSGKTVAIAAGASTSGMGRAGAVDWCTTAKTSPFTSVSGKGYFVNTTSGAVTVTLPASPSAGDIIAVSDYAQTSATNVITLCRNSSKIEGGCANKLLNTNGDAITLVYVDGTKGWKLVNTADQDTLSGLFVKATGGTVLTCGDFKTHVFTSDGTFEVTSAGAPGGSTTVEYLVVAGGGGGGDGSGSGAAGAGGYRQNYPSPVTGGLSVSAQSYSITVGGGGAFSSTPTARGSSGVNSVFSTITSAGGGGGGSENPCVSNVRTGGDGGSGGGGVYSPSSGGSGNTPPVSPSQGNNGGAGGGNYSGGGGGGAGAVGNAGQPNPGVGGVGSPIADAFFGPTAPSYGTPGPSTGRYFAGGGGGGNQPPLGTSQAPGGAGGGGTGALATGCTQATAGTANTGGGGGGGLSAPVQPNGSGGSGFVAIRYKFQ